MAIDGFFVKHLVNELKNELLDLRVLKITQIKKDIFLFHFNKSGKKMFLNFKLNSPNASTFITNDIIVNDDNISSGFLSNLKRIFEASFLTNIKQHLNDRVIIFEFTINDFLDGKIKKELVFEIMGRHNNLIVLENNIVIDAYSKKFSENSRSIIPKINFEFFPSNKTVISDIDYHLVNSNTYLSKNYMGFSLLLSKYLFDNNTDPFNTSLNPTLNITQKQFYWFNLFDENDDIISFDTLSNLLAKLVYEGINDYSKQNNFIEKELVKLFKRRANLENDLTLANNDLSLKEIGNLIYSSGKNLNEKHSHLIDFSNNEVKLDSNYTLLENAKRSFKKYQKAVRAIKHINENIDQTYDLEKELLSAKFYLSLDNPNSDEINEALVNLGYKYKRKTNPNKIAKMLLLKFDYLNTIIYVGKNNKQNDYITNKIATNNDYWLHVSNAPGSHVLIKDSNPSDDVLTFAAMLAAYYSTLRDNGKVLVNYTKIKNVKRIPGKPGHMVLIENYETILVKVDEKLINEAHIANKLK